MKYSLNEVEDDEGISIENDDCAINLITNYETEYGNIEAAMMDDKCVSVIEIERCDDEETITGVESETFYEESFPDA